MESITESRDAILAIIDDCRDLISRHNSMKPKSLQDRIAFNRQNDSYYKLSQVDNSTKFTTALRRVFTIVGPAYDLIALTNAIRKKISVSPERVQPASDQGAFFTMDTILELKSLDRQLLDKVIKASTIAKDMEAVVTQWLLKANDYKMTTVQDCTLIVECMKRSHAFIPQGCDIIRSLLGTLRFDSSARSIIRRSFTELKLECLNKIVNNEVDVNDSKGNQTNGLQTFGIRPSGPSLSLDRVMHEWFGIELKSVNLKTLSSALASISGSLNKPIGVVLVQLDYPVDYQMNTDALFDPQVSASINPPVGVNRLYIDSRSKNLEAYKPAHRIENATQVFYSDLNVKYSAEMFIMWTYDNETFRSHKKSIPNNIAHRIASREPSELIHTYNRVRETKMLELMSCAPSEITFKETKYMAFNAETDEYDFMTRVRERIVTALDKLELENIKRSALIDTITTAIIAQYEADPLIIGLLNIHAHSRMIYDREASIMASHIATSILEGSSKPVDIIIGAHLRNPENMFSKFVASYYLTNAPR